MILAAAGLLGIGGGATVSPGLYLAALSLLSKMVGSTFALVELCARLPISSSPRSCCAWRVASGEAELGAQGIQRAIWVTLLIAAAATGFGMIFHLAGRADLPKPDTDGWINENRPAIGSPMLAEGPRQD